MPPTGRVPLLTPHLFGMRSFLILLGFLLFCLLLAAAINYPLYLLLSQFGEVRADRVLYRSAMLMAAIGIWPLLRRLRLNDRAGLGLGQSWPQIRWTWVRGFLYGVFILGILGGGLVLLGIRPLKPLDAALALMLAKTAVVALISGLLIGLIEEIFFRGILFGGLRRHYRWLVTALITSLFYAFLHFVRPTPPVDLPIGWDTGFVMLAGALHKYASPGLYYDSFIALFMVGMFLALVRERSGGIALGMGMHAGWVFVIKLTKKATETDWQSPFAVLIGHYDGVIGWLAAGWIGVVALAVYWRGRRPPDASERRPVDRKSGSPAGRNPT